MANFQSTIELKAVTQDIDKKLKKVRQGLEGVNKKVQDSTRQMNAFSAKGSRDLDQVGRSGDKLSKTFKGLESRIKGMTTGLKIFGGIFTSVVAGKAVASAAAFEKGMSAVRATTNANTADMKKLTAEALRLGASTKFTAGEASDAMLKLSMAGFTANETYKATADTLALASAGALGLGESADIASNVLAGFDLKVKDLARVTDVMAKAASSSNTSVQELGFALSYVGPVAEQSGLSIEDTVAAIGKLSDAGIKGTRAGTNVRGMLLRLQKPSAEARGALSKLGIETRDAHGKFRPFIEIMKEFGEATKDSADYAAVFGRVASSGAGVIAKAATQGSIQTLGASLRDANGAAKTMASIRMDNLSGSIKLMTSAWDGLVQSLMQGKALHFMQDRVDGLAAIFVSLKNVVDNFDSNYGESLRNMRDVTSGSMSYISGEFKAFFDIMNYGPNYVFERFIASLKTLQADVLGFVYALRVDTILQKMYNSVLNVLIDIGLLFVKFYAMGPVRSWNTFWGTSFTQPIENILTVLGGKIQGKFISFWTEFLPEKILTVKLQIILNATQFIIERWVKGLAGGVGKFALNMWSSIVSSLKNVNKLIAKVSRRFTKSFLDIFRDFGKEIAKSASKYADIFEEVLKLVGIEIEFDGISEGVFSGIIKLLKKVGKEISKLMGNTVSKSLKLFGKLGKGFVRIAEDIYDGVVGAFYALYMRLIGGSIIPDIVEQSTDRWKILRKSFDLITTALVGETISSWKGLVDIMAKTTADISTRMIFHWLSLSAVISSTTGVMGMYVGAFSKKAAGSMAILNNVVVKNRHAIDSVAKSYAGLSKVILPLALLLNAGHIRNWAVGLKDGIQSQDWASVGRSMVEPLDYQFSTIINMAHKVAYLSARYIGKGMKEVVGHTEKYLPRVTEALKEVKESVESFFDRNLILGSIKAIVDSLATMLTSLSSLFTGFSSDSVGGMLVNAFLTVQGIKLIFHMIKLLGLKIWGEMKVAGTKAGASFMSGFDAGFLKRRAAFEAKLKAWEAGRAAGNVMGAKPVLQKDAMKTHEKMMAGLNAAFARAGVLSRQLFDKLKTSMINFDLSKVGQAFSGLFSQISALAGLVKKNASMGPSVAGATLGGKAGISGLVGKLAKYKIFSIFIRKENEKTAAHAASMGKKSGRNMRFGMGAAFAGLTMYSLIGMNTADASEFGEEMGQSVTEGIEKALEDQAAGGSLMTILMDTAMYGSMLIGTGIYTKIGEAFVAARAFIWPFALRFAAALSIGSLGIGALAIALGAGFVAATAALVYGIYKAGQAVEKYITKPMGFAADDLADKLTRANVLREKGWGTVESKDLFGDWDENLGIFQNLKRVGQNFKSNVSESVEEAARTVKYLYEKVVNKGTIALVQAGVLDPVHNIESFLRDQTQTLLEAGRSIKEIADATNFSSVYTLEPVKNVGFNEELGEQLLKSTLILDKGMEKLWNKYANTTPKWIENFDLKGIKEELHALINEQVSAGSMADDNWFFDDAEEAVEFVTKELGLAKAAINGLNAELKSGKIKATEYQDSVKTLTTKFKEGAVDAGIAMKDSFTLMPPLMQEVILAQAKLSEAMRDEANHRLRIVNAISKTKLNTAIANKQAVVFHRIVMDNIKAVNAVEMTGFTAKFKALDEEHQKLQHIAALKAKLGLVDVTTENPEDLFADWLKAQEKMLSSDEKRAKKLEEITRKADLYGKMGKINGTERQRYILSELGELDSLNDSWDDLYADALQGQTKIEKATHAISAAQDLYNEKLAVTAFMKQGILKQEYEEIKAHLLKVKALAEKDKAEKDAADAQKVIDDAKKERLAALDRKIRDLSLTARAAARTVEGLQASLKAALLGLEKEFIAAYGEGWRKANEEGRKLQEAFGKIREQIERKFWRKRLLLSQKGWDGMKVAMWDFFENMQTKAELLAKATTSSLNKVRDLFVGLVTGKDTDIMDGIKAIFTNFAEANAESMFNQLATGIKNSELGKKISGVLFNVDDGKPKVKKALLGTGGKFGHSTGKPLHVNVTNPGFGQGQSSMMSGGLNQLAQAGLSALINRKGDSGGFNTVRSFVEGETDPSLAATTIPTGGIEDQLKHLRLLNDQATPKLGGFRSDGTPMGWGAEFGAQDPALGSAVAATGGEGDGEGFFGELGTTLSEGWTELGTTLNTGWTNLSKFLHIGWESLSGVLKGAWENLSGIFDGIFGENGILSGLFGPGGLDLGGMFSSIGSSLGFSEGGIVPEPTNPGAGPTDTVPAMLTPGETVLPVDGGIIGEGIASLVSSDEDTVGGGGGAGAFAQNAVAGVGGVLSGALGSGGKAAANAALLAAATALQAAAAALSAAGSSLSISGSGITEAGTEMSTELVGSAIGAADVSGAASSVMETVATVSSTTSQAAHVQAASMLSMAATKLMMSSGGGLLASTGGLLSGPGSSTSDSISARLSNGEYVINAASTKKYQSLLKAINEGTLDSQLNNPSPPAFAKGGQVGGIPTLLGGTPAANGGSGMANPTYNTTHINISGNVDQRSIDQIRQVITTSPKQVHISSKTGERANSGLRPTRRR
jgi:TP901 family phage tail tape measure protein